MAHAPEVRQQVRSAYVRQRLPLRAAADAAGVPYDTARAWKRQALEAGDDWDAARTASRLADGGLADLTTQVVEDFALVYQATLERLREPGAVDDPVEAARTMAMLADSYVKMVRAAGNAAPQFSKYAVSMQVLEELAEYLRRHKPDLLAPFAAVLEPFGQHLSKVMA